MLSGYSQETISGGADIYIKRGDRFKEKYDYKNAIKQYQKAFKLESKNDSLRLRLAESYKLDHNSVEAEKWYASVVDTLKELPFKYHLDYAQTLTANGKYDQARFWLQVYDEEVGGDDLTHDQISFLDNLGYYVKDTINYRIEEVEFNSEASDYSPLLVEDGLVFVSDRGAKRYDDLGNAYFELFKVKYSQDSISRSVLPLLKSKKHNFHDGPATLVGNTLIFTRSVSKGEKEYKNKLRLYSVERDSLGVWQQEEPLELLGKGVSIGHPTLSSDGTILYFVSDKEGGKGKADLYRSVKIDNQWTQGELLTGQVNTIGSELFPYLYRDSVLYFSSDGHAGLGGLDIYKMTLTGIDSGHVMNVGAPINSSQDDFGITLTENGMTGYFSSNRDGGLGGDDIYKINKGPIKRILIEGFTKGGQVTSDANLGHVLIYDKVTNERLGESDNNGFFKVELDGEKEYDIALKALDKKGYELDKDFYEISFEGLVKHKVDSNHIVKLIITDALTGDTVYKKSEDNKFTYFILKKERKYNFMASIPEGEEIDVSDIEFEGFIKGTKEPVIISEMDIVDHSTQSHLFKSDKNGYFHFPMENNREYNIMPESQVAEKIDIWMEGYMKVPDGEFIPPSLYVETIEGEQYEFQNSNGYFGFPAKEGESYKLSASEPDIEKDYNVAEKLSFEGFVQDNISPVAIGQVQMYDAGTGQLLFTTDELGFFSFDLDPDVDYKFIAKKPNGEGGNVTIRFDGLVKDQQDSVTYAQLSIIDPETGKEIVKQDMKGFFKFDLTENKIYEVKTDPIPVKKDVLKQVNLIAFSANEIFKQLILQETQTGKLFEVNLESKHHYYTDGTVKREFKNKINKDTYDLQSVIEFLALEGLTVKDTIVFYNIYYKYNSSDLDADSKKSIDKLADFMTLYPSIKMVVSSHADSRGSGEYNKKLTTKRNDAVIDYLEKKGVEDHRTKAISNGDLESLEKCEICSEKDHDSNRRTDFHVISF